MSITDAIKIREAITSKMTSSIRAELRRQIDGRYARKAAQYDSVTGTSSSIQGGVVKALTTESGDEEDSKHGSAQGDLPGRRDSPFQHLITANSEPGKLSLRKQMIRISRLTIIDDLDNDLSWYRSRIKKIRLL